MNGTSSVCCTSVVVSSSKIEVDGNTVEVTFIGGREVTIASGCILDVTLTGGRAIEVDVTLAGGRTIEVDVTLARGNTLDEIAGRVDVTLTGGRVKVTFGDGCSEGVNTTIEVEVTLVG